MAARKRRSRTTVYQLKKGATSAAYNFFTVFGIFAVIMLLTVFFILFQWKNLMINRYLKEIDQLKLQVMQLHSMNSDRESRRNELLKNVPYVAADRLDMIFPLEAAKKVRVDKKVLLEYEHKDQDLSK